MLQVNGGNTVFKESMDNKRMNLTFYDFRDRFVSTVLESVSEIERMKERQKELRQIDEEESAYFKQVIKECTDILMRRT